jgi:hypothetical protein
MGLLAPALVLDDDADIHPHQRPHVGSKSAVAGGAEDGLVAAGQRDIDLDDAGVGGAGRGVGAPQQFEFLLYRQTLQRIDRRVQCRRGRRRPPGLDHTGVAAAHDGAGRAGGLAQRRQAQFIAVGEPLLVAGQRAHADTLLGMVRSGFDDAIFQRPGLGQCMLEVQVRRVDPGLHQPVQHARDAGFVQFGRGEECLPGKIQCIAHKRR